MPRRKRKPNKHRAFINANRHRYDELFEKQGQGCALCGRPPKNRKLALDHDHRRMVIRGLLCFRCNTAIPTWFTREWLLKAADYVEGEA